MICFNNRANNNYTKAVDIPSLLFLELRDIRGKEEKKDMFLFNQPLYMPVH